MICSNCNGRRVEPGTSEPCHVCQGVGGYYEALEEEPTRVVKIPAPPSTLKSGERKGIVTKHSSNEVKAIKWGKVAEVLATVIVGGCALAIVIAVTIAICRALV